MYSTFSITTSASDLKLLSIAEMRAALNIQDNSKDSELNTLNSRISAVIARECKVRVDGSTPPTLKLEIIKETFTNFYKSRIILSRKPIVSIVSLIENETTLVLDTDFIINKSNGILQRIDSSGNEVFWGGWFSCGDLITIDYTAGWNTVPDDLKLAAVKLAQDYWADSQKSSGSDLREVELPGVIRKVYQTQNVSNSNINALPQDVMDLLSPYINHRYG